MTQYISPAQPMYLAVPAKCGQRIPTETEWEASRSEIKHLYIHKRQKLRQIIRYMEVKHNFKATYEVPDFLLFKLSLFIAITNPIHYGSFMSHADTVGREQMYKKRFAKWGLQKNSRRSPSTRSDGVRKYTSPSLTEITVKFRSRSSSISESIQLNSDDFLKLSFLHSIRTWSLGFFQAIPFPSTPPSVINSALSKEAAQCHSPRETILALQLVSDMLDRGYGTLAGKLARKAFLLIENMLTLEGPALVWNLLEVFHSMIDRQHEQLFRTLLAHVVMLVSCRIEKGHPLAAMLDSLQRFIFNSTDSKLSVTSCASSSPSTPESQLEENDISQNCMTLDSVSNLLHQAWILNAELLFDHFDLTWFRLYLNLHWESCSIPLPLTIIHTVKQWLTQMEKIKEFRGDQNSHSPIHDPTTMEHLVEQRQHKLDLDALPLQDYESLRTDSITALYKHLDSVLSPGTPYNENIATKLRIMPALVKARMVERFADNALRSSTNISQASNISHDEASSLACVIRALMDIDADGDGIILPELPNAIEKMQALISLREYANGRTDPQVIQEMWLLEDVLIGNGYHEEASRIRRGAIRRLQDYTRDIPVYSI